MPAALAGTRWDVRQVGLILAALVVELLLPPDAAILLAIDETLTRRRGPKVFAASWWHDGSAAGAAKIGYGNSWVVLAIVVTLPFCRRPIALPILFALCVKGGRSKPDLVEELRAAGVSTSRACQLVGRSRATHYRHARPPVQGPKPARLVPDNGQGAVGRRADRGAGVDQLQWLLGSVDRADLGP